MQTHYISFRKFIDGRGAIRLEFAIRAISKQEARLIAEKEASRLDGFRYDGSN